VKGSMGIWMDGSAILLRPLLGLGAILALGCDPTPNPRAQPPSKSAPASADPAAAPAQAPAARPSAAVPELKDLQGAWWSDSTLPTADFGILGEQVWLDPEAGLNPCRIVGDTLVFDLDGGARQVRNRIVRHAGDTLVLENGETGVRWEVVRARR
jgi:hypothetical protein